MSSIDERVVEMKFNNSQFERGIQKTLSSLDGLKKGLKLDSATKGIQDLDAAGKKFNLDPMANAIQGLAGKFSALSIIGITALTNITNKAIAAGSQMLKSLTLEPINAGFQEYELKMGSIQTILANTSRHGTGLQEVAANLDELNTYADQTIYNFGDMTKNIGLFTNAGIKIGDATSMIKGFSNEAAASGTTSQGAAGAAYQLSQALSAGKITLMDWRSLQNVGMGNKNMQNGIIEIASAMDTFKGKGTDATKAGADFNGSLEKGWLTADVMSTYLKIMAGDMDETAMAAMGLDAATIDMFKKQAQMGLDAATKVRTWTQLIGTMQEGVGSGWSQTFDLLIGDFDQATEMWTAVNDTLGTMISASGDARNNLVKEFVDLGGRDVAISAIANAFHALMAVLAPVKEAFREIFPPATGQQLFDLTVKIRDFFEYLKIGGELAGQIKRIFTGFFAALDIGRMIFLGIVDVLKNVIGTMGAGESKIIDFAAEMGDLVVKFRDALKDGEALNKFFNKLSYYLVLAVVSVKTFIGWIGQLFNGDFNGGGASAALDNLRERFEPITKMLDVAGRAWKSFMGILGQVWQFMLPFAQMIGAAFGRLGDTIANAISTGDFSGVLDALNTGIFAVIGLAIKKFLDGGINIDMGGGLVDSIKEVFGGLTDTLSTLQANIKADTLLKIAAAVGILTISVVALSLIDSVGLTKALTAITIMFAQLVGALVLFEKVSTVASAAKMTIMAAGLLALATAIVILTAAVTILAQLSWEELGKGLVGVATLLVVLARAMKLMQGSTKGLTGAAIGMIAISVAVLILSKAVESFAGMDWADMAQGLAGVAASMLILAGAMKLMPKNMPALSAGLALVGVSLLIIAGAIKLMASMSWEEMARGLTTLAASLLILVVATKAMESSMPGAQAMIVVAGAIGILTLALMAMSSMSWEDVIKGLVALAGMLVILTVALSGMTTALPGASAMIVAAGAIAILTPALMAMASLSWEEIGKGLLMLAGVFVVIGLAGLVLTPVIPSLLGLGVAVGLLGAGTMMAGVGLLAFSAGLTALSISGAAGAAALTAMAAAIIGLIPMALKAVGEGLVLLAIVIGEAAPSLVGAIVALMLALLEGIRTVTPQIADTIVVLIIELLNLLVIAVPRFVDAGMKIITGVLKGIANNIGKVVTAATDVIVEFLKGISNNLPRIVQAGADLIIKFVESLADGVRNNSRRMEDAGVDLADAIIDGVVGGIGRGAARAISKAKEMAMNVLNGAKKILGIASPSKEFYKVGAWSTEGMANAFDKTGGNVTKASERVGSNALIALKKAMSNLDRVVDSNVDLSPTIQPVLDLTLVKKEVKSMDGLFSSKKLNVDASYSKASVLANSEDVAALTQSQAVVTENTVNYTQNNNSPKPLSSAEIYRQTKNQLSTVKEGLPK